MLALSYIKDAIRSGTYAWPGGYPTFFLACDGGVLSHAAVKQEWRQVVRAHLRKDSKDDFALCAHDVNWEDPHLYCEHTGKRINPAYTGEA